MTERIILTFTNVDQYTHWTFDINPKQVKLFIQEIEQYNEWINLLLTGRAPLTSYELPKYARRLYVCNYEGYTEEIYPKSFNKAQYKFNRADIFFQVYNIDDPNQKYSDEEEARIYREQDLDNISLYSELVEMIVTPFDIFSRISLGYKLLPLTEFLFKDV